MEAPTVEGRLFGTISNSTGVDAGKYADYLTSLKSELNLELQMNQSESVASLVPARIVRRYIEDKNMSKMESFSETFDCAVLFADISGFSALAERLVKEINHAAYAAENLSQYIGASLEQMVAFICQNGGDVIKFAGDAILAIFTASHFGNDLAFASRMCCQVALNLSSREFTVATSDLNLSVHCGVGSGTVVCFHVGGVDNRWEYIVSGAPVDQMGRTEPEASSGQTVISKETYELVKTDVEGDLLDSGNFLLSHVNINKDTASLSCSPQFAIRDLHDYLKNDPTEHRRMQSILRCYVPIPALISIDSGNGIWSGELRVCTTVFCRIIGLEYESRAAELVQQAFIVVQKQYSDYGGTLLRFIVDDKGAGVLVGYGLPPQKHENDAFRAIKASLEIICELSKLGIGCSIGISTGEVFCGTVGGRLRAEYTLHGVKVNLAARLMGAANSGILCDAQTYEETKTFVEFEDGYEITVKGKEQKVTVYRPQRVRVVVSLDNLKIKLIGRANEQVLVKNMIKYLQEHDQNIDQKKVNIIFYGDAGMGKTSVCRYVVQKCKSKNLVTLSTRGDDTEKLTPGFVWKTLLIQLLGYFSDVPILTLPREDFVRCILARIPKNEISRFLVARCSLLQGEILDDNPDFEEDNPQTAMPSTADDISPVLAHLIPDISGHNHNRVPLPSTETSLNLLVRVLVDIFTSASNELAARETDPRKIVIVIEDMQWVDDYSTEVLYRLVNANLPMGIVITSREKVTGYERIEPMIEENAVLTLSTLYDQIAEMATYVELKPLERADIEECITYWYETSKVPANLCDIIFRKSQGHPFFAHELCELMVADNRLTFENGVCNFKIQNEGEDLGLPNSISALMTSRLDRIPTAQQLTLKVAAVIGSEFRIHLLASLLLRYSATDEEPEGLVGSRHLGDNSDLGESMRGGEMRQSASVHKSLVADGDLREIAKLLLVNIESLVDKGFLVLEKDSTNSEQIVRFSSLMLRESAYGLLLFKMRKALHKTVAELLEERNGDYLQPAYYLIARHYYSAEMFEKTLFYLEIAGNDALAAQAMQRGWACFSKLMELHKLKKIQEISVYRLASWHRKTAEADMYFGRIVDAEAHLLTALHLLNLNVTSCEFIQNRELVSSQTNRKGLFRRFQHSVRGSSQRKLRLYWGNTSYRNRFASNRGIYTSKFIMLFAPRRAAHKNMEEAFEEVHPEKRWHRMGRQFLHLFRTKQKYSDQFRYVPSILHSYNRVENTEGFKCIVEKADINVETFLEASRVYDLLASMVDAKYDQNGVERISNMLTLAKAAHECGKKRKEKNTEIASNTKIMLDLDHQREHEGMTIDAVSAATDQLVLAYANVALYYTTINMPWSKKLSRDFYSKANALVSQVTDTNCRASCGVTFGEYELVTGSFQDAQKQLREATWAFNFLKLSRTKCKAIELLLTCCFFNGEKFHEHESLGAMLFEAGQGFPVVHGLRAFVLARASRYRYCRSLIEQSVNSSLSFLESESESAIDERFDQTIAKIHNYWNIPDSSPVMVIAFALLLSRHYGYKRLALKACTIAATEYLKINLQNLPINEFPGIIAIFQVYSESFCDFVDIFVEKRPTMFRRTSTKSFSQQDLARMENEIATEQENINDDAKTNEDNCDGQQNVQAPATDGDLESLRVLGVKKMKFLIRIVEAYASAYPTTCGPFLHYCRAIRRWTRWGSLDTISYQRLERAATEAHEHKLLYLKCCALLEIATYRRDSVIFDQLEIWFRDMDAGYEQRRVNYEQYKN